MRGERFDQGIPQAVKETADVIEFNIKMSHSTKEL
jgi:hypothetical protein